MKGHSGLVCVSSHVNPNFLVGIGNGGIEGTGTMLSNASVVSNTNYNGNGVGNVVVKGQGSSVSNNGTDTALDVNANADLANTNGLANCKPFSQQGSIF